MLNSERFSRFVDKAKAVVNAHLELEKLKAVETFSDSFARLLSGFIIAALLMLFLFVFSIFGGMALSDYLGSFSAGFAIVSGFYLILFLVFLIYRKALLRTPIQNKIITYFFKDEQ